MQSVNIPNGWESKKLSALGRIVSGGTPDTDNMEYWNGDIAWLTPSEVSGCDTKYLSCTARHITDSGLQKSSAILLPEKSLIICTRATIGDCCINSVPMCTNQGFKSIILSDSSVEFLYYVVKHNKNAFIRKACGSTFLEISKRDVENLIFAIPPLPEQEKIAKILSCWDDAIEQMQNLIAQKKELKRGLMQQLLTRKLRIRGFNSEWKKFIFGDEGTIYSGLSGKAASDFGNGCPFITYMTVYSGNTIDLTACELVNIDDKENQNYVEYGDVFFTVSSETPEEVGMGAVLLSRPETRTYLNSFCLGYRLNNFNSVIPEYLAYSIRSVEMRKIMYKLAQGATRFNLSRNALLREHILVPSDTAEQKAIADVLVSADAEIDLLNKKLDVLKEQKKGLMQKLLTGEIRVKVDKKITLG